MAQELISLGTAPLGEDGDTVRAAFEKVNANADELYAASDAAATKLATIATGATANATDAQLRNRATHTGEQAISTVTGLVTELAGKQASNANLAALAGLAGATDRLPYFTGVGALSLATLTAFGRSLTAAADAAAGRAALSVREQLTAARTYFVRADGSDSNTGLTNTAGGAFLTIQKAVDVVSALDIGVFNVTISVEPSDGGYNVGSGVKLKSLVGSGVVTIRGNGSSPVNTQIFSSGGLLATEAVFFASGIAGSWRITNVGIYSVGSGVSVGIQASSGSKLTAGNINYGSGFTNQIRAIDSGALEIDSKYSISGSATTSLAAVGSSSLRVQNVSVTITGTPTFAVFCSANQSGTVIATGITFIGSATGQRFNASLNGVINSNNAGLSYFPGSVEGATTTGGQYV